MSTKSNKIDWGGMDLTVRNLLVNADHPGQTGTSVTDGNFTINGAAGTGADTAGLVNLETPETTIVAADQLGRIDFSAPSEASGSDAILVGASIWAEAEGTFDATTNTTAVVIATGASETAVEKFRVTSTGGTRGPGPVVITDVTSYTVLATNSGRVHTFPDFGSTCTATLPAAAAGLEFEFWYAGVATDAQNFVVTTQSGEFMTGGVLFANTSAAATTAVYADGAADDVFTVITPAGGTWFRLISNGTTWFITGQVVSATVCTLAAT
jgi:hypothetical protein